MISIPPSVVELGPQECGGRGIGMYFGGGIVGLEIRWEGRGEKGLYE